MDQLTSIEVDQFLAHPPSRVWQALTRSDLLARWLMPNDFELAAGHRFTFRTDPIPSVGFDGLVHCQVLAFDPEKMLKISWRGGHNLDSTVTWRLVPEGKGTRLLLEHAGFDPDDAIQQVSRKVMDGGWRSHIMRALEACLAEVGALTP